MGSERDDRQAELNTMRVIRCDEKNYDKVMVRLPKGSAERIRALGQVPASFIRDITLAELDKIENTLERIGTGRG